MKEQSIFEYMVDHVVNGVLEEGFTLRNYDQELQAKCMEDGAIDMVARYNVDQIDERNFDGIVNEIENAVILVSNGTFDEADRWFADLGEKYRIINIAHLIFDYIGENSEELYLDNIFQGAMHLVTESKNTESVKAGLVMLAMFQYDFRVKNIVRLLAQSDEFAYFAVRVMDEWENGNLEIFQIARKLSGWGKIYAIEMLEPSNIYIRDWISREAMNLNVPQDKIPKDYYELIHQVKNVNVPNKYLYCQVLPYGFDEEYSYIFPGDLIAIGDNVVIPFGADNELIVGKVMSHKICTADEAPYPVDSVKTILRVMENDEIVEDFPEIAELEGLTLSEEAQECDHDHCGCGCEHHDHNHDHEHGDQQEPVAQEDQQESEQEPEHEKATVTPISDDIVPPWENIQYPDDDDDEEDMDDEEIEFVESELDELADFIEEDDVEAILEWAIIHDSMTYSEKIMTAVQYAYEYCIDSGYEVDTAALNLGTIYYSGVAVPRDYAQAAKYYQMAADEGNVQAICNLGYCYYYGRHQAVDYDKAYGCFNMAGLMGSANALYKLGDMYLNGRHVEANPIMAFKIYMRAEESLEPWEDCRADIEMRIGRCYLRGIGVEVDLDLAMENLCSAYAGLYARRATDPFVKGVINTCKDLLNECEEAMADHFVKRK